MRYLTLAEAAQRLGVSEQKVLQWVQDGTLSLPDGSSYLTSKRSGFHFLIVRDLRTFEREIRIPGSEIEELEDRLAWMRLGTSRWEDDY